MWFFFRFYDCAKNEYTIIVTLGPPNEPLLTSLAGTKHQGYLRRQGDMYSTVTTTCISRRTGVCDKETKGTVQLTEQTPFPTHLDNFNRVAGVKT